MLQINFLEIVSAFIILFAIIDVTGSIPIFLSLRDQGKPIRPVQSCVVSLIIFLAFFYVGDALLRMFSVDTASFAVAGSFVLFILALEMVVGVEIMKTEAGGSGASVVPIAFPLVAGPGALTTLLALRAEYANINIMIAILMNMVIVFIVLKFLDKLSNLLGHTVIVILRKFFGVLLLAIAVKMFASNLAIVIHSL